MNLYTNLEYNRYTEDISPSAISKILPNCENLSDTKENRVYKTIKPITLYIGNTAHDTIDYNNGDLMETLNFVMTSRGYQNGELSMTKKQADKNNITAKDMHKLHKEILMMLC